MLDFNSQVVLVTGAGSGLGRSYATALARRGASVVVNDVGHRAEGGLSADALCDELEREGLSVVADRSDISIEAEARNAVEATVRRFGRIDALINNAGIAKPGSISDTHSDVFAATMATHVFGSFWTMQQAVRHMRAVGYGRIINTTSGLGLFGLPNSIAYATAKAALFGMTRSAALDNLDVDIKINALSPIAISGLAPSFEAVDQRLTADKMRPEQVAPVALFLSHQSCPVSGETISAAGGRTARIFTATAAGYHADPLTPEALQEHWGSVMAPDGWKALTSSLEQYEMIP